MNNLEYLNHIAQSNRPLQPAPKQSKVNGALILKILVCGLVATAIIIGASILLNSNSRRATDLTKQLYMRMSAVNASISNYNRRLKSSQLRSISYSLSGTLTGTSTQLGNYLKETYPNDKSPLVPSSSLATTESAMLGGVDAVLDRARLNGTLDRAYATQMQLLVSLMMTLTSEILAIDDDAALIEILTPFYSNLNIIEQSFENYSNPGD